VLEKGQVGEGIFTTYQKKKTYGFSKNTVSVYEPWTDCCTKEGENETK
jgi:hypothetical protein